jgi:hypothetical protein
MSYRGTSIKQATALAVALSFVALSTIGGADGVVEKRRANVADEELFFAPVPKAVCGPGDKPETALQGQVPAAMRAAGFQGFSCNLQLLAQVRGEGANWQTTEWREGRGKNKRVCAYHGTAAPTFAGTANLPRVNYGVRVIDISNPAAPFTTSYLNTTSMLDPWESLKVNERRKLLGAVNGQNGAGGPEFDLYDISGDCRYPQLLFSGPIGVGADEFPFGIVGHEGNFAPDGLTYYGGGRTVPNNYYAIDITNVLAPKLITQWNVPLVASGARTHGMSVSDDGTRGYFVSIGSVSTANLMDPAFPSNNGLVIYDLTDIQQRRSNPVPRPIGQVYWRDGATAQHTINVTIRGRRYVIFVDEGGTAGTNSPAQLASACAAGLSPFPMARIIDINDERNPTVISKLMLEVHDPANCDQVLPDLAGLTIFTYGSHYCSVDNIHRATTLACGYFNSGIRVFDIRDPVRPREIAYYNPAGTTTPSAGSNHLLGNNWMPGGPDWCAAQVHMDAAQGTLWTTCQDNGLLSLKFTHNAWPFGDSTTPPGMQN